MSARNLVPTVVSSSRNSESVRVAWSVPAEMAIRVESTRSPADTDSSVRPLIRRRLNRCSTAKDGAEDRQQSTVVSTLDPRKPIQRTSWVDVACAPFFATALERRYRAFLKLADDAVQDVGTVEQIKQKDRKL